MNIIKVLFKLFNYSGYVRIKERNFKGFKFRCLIIVYFCYKKVLLNKF